MTDGVVEYVDAHCHVDLYASPAEILRTVESSRIHTVAVTNAPFVFEFTRNLAKSSRYLHAAVGMHPELIATHGDRLDEIWPLIPQTRFVGEVGLDYVTQDETLRERQRAAFCRILDACRASGNKVITVHSRRSASDVVEIIGRSFPGTIILHWFSGSKAELRRAIDRGFYFSVNRAMLQSKSGMALLTAMPEDQVLTETDGPYTMDDNARATPESVIRTCALLGEVWKRDPEEAARKVRQNFEKATGIPPVISSP